MWDLFKTKESTYNLRRKNQLSVIQSNTKRYGSNSLSSCGANLWNTLPENIKMAKTLKDFRQLIGTWEGEKCKCTLCTRS
mgnify:CR=1 FL=1